ncbi:MAG: carboxypeptidase regulatory-like domain-containing protein [Actinomycetota bacterium]|nr:carboxypeptidase regulatory-like domain-containing protein [Actinomycetota bacterium]
MNTAGRFRSFAARTFLGALLVLGIAGAAQASPAAAGGLSGTVTGPDDSPLQFICVTLYTPNNAYVDNEVTEADGSYSFSSLAAGQYKLSFEDCGEHNVISEFYDDETSLSAADPVSVAADGITGNINAELAAGGYISGTLVDEAGEPLEGICANAATTEAGYGGLDVSGADGEYKIPGLATGTYVVVFFTCGGENVVNEFFNDQPTFETADPIDVTAGFDTPNIDAELAPAGSITGTVTDSDGEPLSDVCLTAFDSAGANVAGTYVGSSANGSYTIQGLPTGDYRVRFESCGANVVREYYDDQPTLATANPVAVTAGSVTSGIDAELLPGGSLSGTVTLSPQGDVQAVCITTYDASGEESGVGYPESDGAYTITGLTEGNHRALFEPCDESSDYLAEYYDNQKTLDTANPIAIVNGETTEQIDVELSPDTTPPETSIESAPRGTITADQATFTFSGTPAEDVKTIECRIDSAAFTDCGNEKTFVSLSEGSHTVEARAVDFAGNVDPTPAAATFTVDLSPGPGPDPEPTAACLAARSKLANAQTRLKKSVRLKKGAVKGKKAAGKSLRKARKSGKRTEIRKVQRKLKKKTVNVKKANRRIRKSRSAVRSARSAVVQACG